MFSMRFTEIQYSVQVLSARKIVFLIVFLFSLQGSVIAQEPNSDKNFVVNPLVGFHVGPQAFHSDSFQLSYGQSPLQVSFMAGLEIKPFFHTTINYQKGQVRQKQQPFNGPLNFQTDFHAFDLRFSWISEQVDQLPLSFFISSGIGFMAFNTFTDAKASNGNSYHFWSDGSIRDIKENPTNSDLANTLERDYVYETPLRLNQRSVFIPVHFGAKIALSHHLDAWVAYELRVLEKDRPFSFGKGLSNDKLQRLTLGLSFTFRPKPTLTTPQTPAFIPAPPIPNPLLIMPVFGANHFEDVDFDAILADDEDKDGVPDVVDSCLQTPLGWLVDAHGCPPDRDLDGIPDQFDDEPDSEKGAWVNEKGVKVSDAFLQECYNDSITYMSQILRKVSRQSRPYPIKRFIPQENFLKWAQMLDEHPSWRPILVSKEQLPAELKIFDSDDNGVISLTELLNASDLLFEGDASMNTDLYFKACEYVFRTQN